ncbi:MAG: hypothetical protein AB7E47_02260 [Desulfovibrionaceae bacterium]
MADGHYSNAAFAGQITSDQDDLYKQAFLLTLAQAGALNQSCSAMIGDTFEYTLEKLKELAAKHPAKAS